MVYLMEIGSNDETLRGYMKLVQYKDQNYVVKWMTTENRFELLHTPYYEVVIKLDFCPKDITPINIQDKLPGLLLFS